MSLDNHTPYGEMLNKIVALSPFQIDWSRIKVVMDMRLRTTGGIAMYSNLTRLSVIKLNATLFATLNDAERYEILAHEMAHAILHQQNIFDKHGYRWQNLHRRLGGTAERCHKHKVIHNVRRRVIIRCQKKGICIVITLQKWNKLRNLIQTKQIPYDFVGVIACDLDTHTYRWEKLVYPELRETPIIKNLKLAA